MLILSGAKSLAFFAMVDEALPLFPPNRRRLVLEGASHQMWLRRPESCRDAALALIAAGPRAPFLIAGAGWFRRTGKVPMLAAMLDPLARLEIEGLLILEDRPFVLGSAERGLVSADLSRGAIKTVSLDPDTGRVGGAAAGADLAALAALMERYAVWARSLVEAVEPRYGPALERGRTSFRPRAVKDGAASPRKDDRRLHADAFPSRPVGGARILRVFSNVDPAGEARVWRVGEPFEAYARRWLPRARRNLPGEAWALQGLGITRRRRTDYDALMLRFHDFAKLDADYQATGPMREVIFPAGSSWIAFTDSLVHAAISGRCALEQTFYLPVSAMADPGCAPLRILERLTGRRLAA